MAIKLFQVGGCVRDELLGVKSKDIDFAVEIESFDAMREWMKLNDFNIFKESPQFFTIRAHFPRNGRWESFKGLTADFVLCRKEGEYSDGRRPDEVTVGDIYDDLSRRDFTINAIAKDMDGNLIDPCDGMIDLAAGILRCVGSAEDRMREDALRALRAIRFSITKDLIMDGELVEVLSSKWIAPLLASVSKERQREEMLKAFKHDTNKTLITLGSYPAIRAVVFSDGLWLEPTMKS